MHNLFDVSVLCVVHVCSVYVCDGFDMCILWCIYATHVCMGWCYIYIYIYIYIYKYMNVYVVHVCGVHMVCVLCVLHRFNCLAVHQSNLQCKYYLVG